MTVLIDWIRGKIGVWQQHIPNLTYGVNIVIHIMANPSQVYREALKWVLIYLNGYLNDGLNYIK